LEYTIICQYDKCMIRVFLFLCLLTASLVLGCNTTDDSSLINNSIDETAYLQALLDSPDLIITIPSRKKSWNSGPLFIRTKDKTIIFEKGCTIFAKKGDFIPRTSCLLTIEDSSNLKIVGYEACLKMRKADYINSPYQSGQWRHGISIKTSRNILIEGLTVQNTGGDGVYIGQSRGNPVCEDIILKKLTLLNNHRQGVSVISVCNFLMEECIVKGTKGTLPMAGIDFEPNSGLYGFTGCVVRDCSFTHNRGPGILVYLKKLGADNPPVDILVKNTISRHNQFSIAVFKAPDDVQGTLTLVANDFSRWKFLQKSENFKIDFVQP
jgi:hypothetical protein